VLLFFGALVLSELLMSDWWLIGLFGALTLSASLLFLYPLKANKAFSLLMLPIILTLVVTAYVFWGSFPQWQAYQQQQEMQHQAQKMLRTIKTPDELITKLKAKLDDTPKSAKGWYLLGRLFSAKNNDEQAAEAFGKAYHFFPENEQYAVNYAHSLWQLNHQQFNAQILQLFNTLLSQNSNQPDALAMLAMNAFMSHDYDGAINYWQRLLKLAPPQSDEALAIHKAIAKAQSKLIRTGNKND
jgi:cytochrome c-type biogenesis protein CcmH